MTQPDNAQIREPTELEKQATFSTSCPQCLAPSGVECDRSDGLRWYSHANRVLKMQLGAVSQ